MACSVVDRTDRDERGRTARPILGLLIGMAFLTCPLAATRAADDPTVPKKIENFSLRDYRGKPFELSELSDYPIVVIAFVGAECPLANLYTPRLHELAERYRPRGVAFVAVNANSQDSVTEIGIWVKKQQIEFPVLKDAGNRVADQFEAQRTPEVHVLDRERVVRYRGRIDDQYSVAYHRPKPEATWLVDALEALLDNKTVPQPITEPDGCHIGRIRTPDATSDVTYSHQISRILPHPPIAGRWDRFGWSRPRKALRP